jgi:hypothetical protein
VSRDTPAFFIATHALARCCRAVATPATSNPTRLVVLEEATETARLFAESKLGYKRIMLSQSRHLFIVKAAAIAALVSLAGCVSNDRAGKSRPRAVATAKPSPKAKPRPSPSSSIPQSDAAAFRQCRARLDQAMVRFSELPNQDRGGGCAIIDSVRLLDFGTPTANLGAMTCELAGHFTAWAQHAVRPAARLFLGSEVVKIETFGTYACRDVRGSGGTIAGKRSEHAHANAVDISAFVLEDGRRISILDNWRDDGPNAQFLQAIHQSACKRFRTVLSPDYNSAHRDHLHFDMGGKGRYCR